MWRDEERRSKRRCEMKCRNDAVAARRQWPLMSTAPGQTFEEIKDAVLLHECPEDLRREVVFEFLQKENRLPLSSGPSVFEDVAAQYVASTLERRHRSATSGPQLRAEEVSAWESLFREYGCVWKPDSTFSDAQNFRRVHGHLRPQKRGWIRRKRGKLSEEDERDKAEDRLARELDVVRRAKVDDVWEYIRTPHKKHSDERALLRRKLSSAEVAKWEHEFGKAWQWIHLPAADGRAQASKQRSDVEAEVLAVMNSVKAEPGLESELGRYHPSVWGKLERQSAGRRTSIAPSRAAQKRCEFHAEHDFDGDARASPDEFEGWDLPACRSLLVTLDENDLKRRLEMSPWSAGQARPEANWLGEAAEAFDVPIGKRSRKNSKKADIIADVLTRIHYINTSAEVSLVARLALIIRRKWCEQISDHGKTCATVVAPSREWLTTAAAFAHSTANTNTDKSARRP